MSSIYDTTSAKNTSSTTDRTGDAFNELSMDSFLKMMIAELQNQDPMNPMDNAQMLTQISQIRSIASNDKLTTTLENVSRGQSFSTASTLIGKTVTGVNTLGNEITDTVDRVVFEDGVPKLHVGSSIVPLDNITAIKST